MKSESHQRKKAINEPAKIVHMIKLTPENESAKFERHLQGINKSIVNLKEDVK